MSTDVKNNESLSYIAEGIRNLAVPIGSISEDPGNVRKHSERNLAAIAGSLRRFGQQRPIVVAGDNTIVAGNGTFAAAKSLGWAHIAVIRTSLKGSERVAFCIADNRSGDEAVGSIFNASALADVLKALQAEDADLAVATGFDAAEISALLAGAANDLIPPEAAGEDIDETIADEVECVVCPKCGTKIPK